ncbi:MAG: alkaline phosphatase family protein [Pseudonocardia sp.]|uniref:alkaline phosphatase family protein n=1 Tax=unclassified Pseudonocardia TaxID=2619320 RepID=UPI00086E2568|nr:MULTISPECIES: nucleotide pyrophosphatase/phosphodiesterase family protein [unclassified Pseudonocardia]MBN9109033.1 alkaline phosphatase family protein [Pseudonocardia sp.]ODU24205.1 MAG: phosphodiesterase [Pseudonocardia sp. SCN 72-51]ODV02577.1 MAG: phosphodiesterase [Pseudonocardia sp. SCN 73-27]
MTAPLLPRYGTASLAEVLPSVLAALGVPGPAPIPMPPVRAACVLLVDGLGTELLRTHAADAPFLSAMPDAGPLTVGFPSTTPISLASLGTGLPPGGHGLVGLSFDPGDQALLDVLRWTRARDGKHVDQRDAHVPEVVQPSDTALQRAAADGVVVTAVAPAFQRESGLTRAALRGGTFRGVLALGDLAAEIDAALTGPGRRLCYGYHSDLDTLGHVHGPGTLPWRLQLRQIDLLVSTIAAALPPDALLVVTGDHGMVTVDRAPDFDTDETLQAGVTLLGGDARARHVYTAPGAAADVLATWQDVLGGDAWVVTRDEAVAAGWFGPLGPHVAGRIGDVVAAMRGGTALVRSQAEPKLAKLVGQHGSLTSAEQLVPLLVAGPES